jgi:Ca-activated chloride channel homolog
MNESTYVRYMLNREYLPVNRESTIYMAIDVIPPENVGFDGMPSAICLLIDRSGSMKKSKIENARAAALELISRLTAEDYIGLVTVSDTAERIVDLDKVSNIDINWLQDRIKNIKAGGGTHLYSGLETAYEQLMHFKGKCIRRVILLSDGQPTDRIPADEFARLASRMREMGISIISMGVGPKYNEDLLSSLAELSGGTWQHISSPAAIPSLFSQYLDSTRTVIQTMPEIVVQAENGVEIHNVYKSVPDVYKVSNIKRNAGHVYIPISDLRAGEVQTFVIQISTLPKEEGAFRLATVFVSDIASSRKDVLVSYSNDSKLWGIENNAFPRGLFAIAETQLLARQGISDETALRHAEKKIDTVIKDINLKSIPVIRDTAIRFSETVSKVKDGLTEEEAKIAKFDLTQTQIRGHNTK